MHEKTISVDAKLMYSKSPQNHRKMLWEPQLASKRHGARFLCIGDHFGPIWDKLKFWSFFFICSVKSLNGILMSPSDNSIVGNAFEATKVVWLVAVLQKVETLICGEERSTKHRKSNFHRWQLFERFRKPQKFSPVYKEIRLWFVGHKGRREFWEIWRSTENAIFRGETFWTLSKATKLFCGLQEVDSLNCGGT